MTVARVLPALLWTVLVAWLSGDSWGGSGTEFLAPYLCALVPWAAPDQINAAIWIIRKCAHVTEYAVLAGLWWWAWAPRGAAIWPVALALSIATAVLDEIHQATTATRTGSVADILLDAAGAGAALVLLAGGGRLAIDRLIGGLLWVAALGGAALLTINWVVAAPTPWLWPSVPVAWIALYLWRRRPGPA
jgi:VanZ family protein